MGEGNVFQWKIEIFTMGKGKYFLWGRGNVSHWEGERSPLRRGNISHWEGERIPIGFEVTSNHPPSKSDLKERDQERQDQGTFSS